MASYEKYKLLLKRIKDKGGLLNDDEAFDFYTKNIMRNQPTCKWSPWRNRGRGGYRDYDLAELNMKAAQWHKIAVGALVLGGELQISSLNAPDWEKWTGRPPPQ